MSFKELLKRNLLKVSFDPLISNKEPYLLIKILNVIHLYKENNRSYNEIS